jgi:hypothetical protein
VTRRAGPGAPGAHAFGVAETIERARVALDERRERREVSRAQERAEQCEADPAPTCAECGAAKLQPVPHQEPWVWCSGCGHREVATPGRYLDVRHHATERGKQLRALRARRGGEGGEP